MIHWTALGFVALLGGLFAVSRAFYWILRRMGAGFKAVKLVVTTHKLLAIADAYVITVVSEPGRVAASAAGSPLAPVAVMVAAVGVFLLGRNTAQLSHISAEVETGHLNAYGDLA